MVVRRLIAAGMLCATLGLFVSPHAHAATRQVDVVNVRVINDVAARTLDRAISDRPAAVVLEINSMGGTQPALDHMLSAVARSQTPVVAYVGDEEVATDAGWILAESGDLIGVSASATVGSSRVVHFAQSVFGTTNAGALASGLARAHHRDGSWAYVAMNNGALMSGSDAVTRNIASYEAGSLGIFLNRALNSGDFSINQVDAGGWDSILNAIAIPDVAYLLMVITLAFLALWFAHPGMFFTLIGAFAAGTASAFAFSQLPINIVGIVLTALATAIFVLDIVASTHGLLTALGAVVMVLGGWQLVDTDTMASGVDLALIAVTVAAIVAAYGFLLPRLLAVRRLPYADPATLLIGKTATVTESSGPEGMVSLEGTLWLANTSQGTLEIGREVRVVQVEGLRLTVRT